MQRSHLHEKPSSKSHIFKQILKEMEWNVATSCQFMDLRALWIYGCYTSTTMVLKLHHRF